MPILVGLLIVLLSRKIYTNAISKRRLVSPIDNLDNQHHFVVLSALARFEQIKVGEKWLKSFLRNAYDMNVYDFNNVIAELVDGDVLHKLGVFGVDGETLQLTSHGNELIRTHHRRLVEERWSQLVR
jgi:hypothetical protein